MNDTNICFLSAQELGTAYRNRTLSPVEVTQEVLHQIEKLNPSLNAFCTLLSEQALTQAKRAEEELSRGEDRGPLHGIPVSIKDNLFMEGIRTTFGSKLLENHICNEDAPIIERLRNAGAIFTGRTNTPEFGWKGVTDNRIFGTTKNPWDLERTPGGSSGGAASAVASGMGPLGIGTDGGGSVRIPAAFCGLVGLKASFGRIPNYPATAVDSLRHTGPLTRTVLDTAIALDVLAGPDERDPSSLPETSNLFSSQIDAGIKGKRMAFSCDLGYASVEEEIRVLFENSLRDFEKCGATIEHKPVQWEDPYNCWEIFFYGGIASNLGPKLADQGDLLDPGLRQVVEKGIHLSAADYVDALMQRNMFWQEVRSLFETIDFLVTPSTAVLPFSIGNNDPLDASGQAPRSLSWTPFSYPFNLTGQPAVTIPCGWSQNGLPAGIQIIGRRFDDLGVLQVARAFEKILPWSSHRPTLVKAG